MGCEVLSSHHSIPGRSGARSGGRQAEARVEDRSYSTGFKHTQRLT